MVSELSGRGWDICQAVLIDRARVAARLTAPSASKSDKTMSLDFVSRLFMALLSRNQSEKGAVGT